MSRDMSIGNPVRLASTRWGHAGLRTKLTVVATIAATAAIVAIVVVAYLAVRHELLSNVDGQLSTAARQTSLAVSCCDADGNYHVVVPPQRRAGDVEAELQVFNAAGAVELSPGGQQLPVTGHDKSIVTNRGGQWVHTATAADGNDYRVLTLYDADLGIGVQVAVPLAAVESQLHMFTIWFSVIGGLGLLIVFCLSWLLVRRSMRPVLDLTETAEEIARTRDLTTRISSYGEDEVGRLAASFNTMLDALERSLGQQRQLVLDASHELRTPLASLRTNVEVLGEVDRLAPNQRRELLEGIVTQLDELTALVADVVELARGEAPPSSYDDVAFDDLVAHAVDRARRHWPSVTFRLTAAAVVVHGIAARLDRAVANLLDNAGKFSGPGDAVDVELTAAGVLTVADRGIGVPHEALPHVFDRFYRADEARAMPGSGLGLAIVKQVIDGHDGTVALEPRPGGGTVARVTLPVRVDVTPAAAAAAADAPPVTGAAVVVEEIGAGSAT